MVLCYASGLQETLDARMERAGRIASMAKWQAPIRPQVGQIISADEWSAIRSLNQSGHIEAHPMPAWPSAKPPKWQDAGKARTGADARAAFTKVLTKQLSGNDSHQRFHRERCAKVIADGRRITEDAIGTLTDGSAILGETGVSTAQCLFPGLTCTPLTTLTPEVWRAYAFARVLRNERSNAIRWRFDADRVTLTGRHADLGDSAAWAPIVTTLAPRTFHEMLLHDRYVWPLRGVAWDVSTTTAGAIVLRAETTVIGIMEMSGLTTF